MPDKVMPGPVQDTACIREAVCIHTKKIYDSCKEEDLAFYNLNILMFQVLRQRGHLNRCPTHTPSKSPHIFSFNFRL